MRKAIIGLVILAILVMSVGVVVAKGPKKRQCDDWTAATCLYTPSDNIHVWHNDDHAICVPMDRFTEDALEGKLADGWYESSSKDGYICKWSTD